MGIRVADNSSKAKGSPVIQVFRFREVETEGAWRKRESEVLRRKGKGRV